MIHILRLGLLEGQCFLKEVVVQGSAALVAPWGITPEDLPVMVDQGVPLVKSSALGMDEWQHDCVIGDALFHFLPDRPLCEHVPVIII